MLTEGLYPHVSQGKSEPVLGDLYLHIIQVFIKMETLPIRDLFSWLRKIFSCLLAVSALFLA